MEQSNQTYEQLKETSQFVIKRAVNALAILMLTAALVRSQPAPPAKIDLNTAPESSLEELPGVSAKTAGKIIASRPYTSLADLSRAGISKHRINRIAPLVTVNSATLGSANRSVARVRTPPALAPEMRGMVWVDKDTKVYHRRGDPLYGMTEHGKYMTEDDALSAGYRAAGK